MKETDFWVLIEAAWAKTGAWNDARRRFLADQDGNPDELMEAAQEMIPHLDVILKSLKQSDLLAFDQILEIKLYEIDRQEIHEFTDGSDDGFLYARGFIVAMGNEYYAAVNADPSRALMDVECEDMCFLAIGHYRDLYGDPPESEISRESGSNPAGWQN